MFSLQHILVLKINWAKCLLAKCKSNPSCTICKSALINRLVTNPHSGFFSGVKGVICISHFASTLFWWKPGNYGSSLPRCSISKWMWPASRMQATKERSSPPDPGPRQNILNTEDSCLGVFSTMTTYFSMGLSL